MLFSRPPCARPRLHLALLCLALYLILIEPQPPPGKSAPLPLLRAAFILHGGVSIVQSRQPVEAAAAEVEDHRHDEYVNFTACAVSIKKYIVDANPDVAFDTFIFSWNPDLRDALTQLYHPRAAQFVHQAGVHDLIAAFGGEYNQAALAWSMQKGYELMEAAHEPYDWVIHYRPDVLLWVPLLLSEYDPTMVYANSGQGHLQDLADFHFVMSHANARAFSRLLDSSAQIDNPPLVHHWIKAFVNKFMEMPLLRDGIVAGRHQEVLRKITVVPDYAAVIAEFGLTAAEVERYGVASQLGAHIP